MYRLLLTFLLLLFLQTGFAQLLIRNTTVVDVESKKLRTGQDVLLVDGRISDIGRKLKAPAGVEVIDGTGKYLMPGLVDAHVHFFQSGSLYTRPDAVDLRKYRPYSEEIAWGHRNMDNLLRRYLRAGITSVVDVGATPPFLRQRDTFARKSYSPTIYMTGPLLTTWQPEVYRNLGEDEPFWLMRTPEEGRALVQKQLPLKPDFIKIWYIVNGRNTDSLARAHLPMIRAVIDEAHRNGLRVAVHATENSTAGLAVEAGADFLVHGVEDGPVSPALLAVLKQKGTVLSPTLWVAGNYYRALGQTYQVSSEDLRYAHPTPTNSILNLRYLKDTALPARLRNFIGTSGMKTLRTEDSLRAVNLKRMADAGIVIATGTDAGNTGTQHVSSYFDELRAMQAAGLDVWALLQASTINGARAVGRSHEFGAVRKGLRADLLLLRRNPLEGIEAWKSIELVINRGTAVQPDSLLHPTPEELADQQLLGYNLRNLDAFLEPYADSVEIYDLTTGKLMMKGKSEMRQQYQKFFQSAQTLHCNILNRIIQGNVVVDQEEVWMNGSKAFEGLAIYEVQSGKIRRVWFP